MLQVRILNPKAKKILSDLASLKLIKIEKEEIFELSTAQKKSIEISRKQIKSGKFRNHRAVMTDLKSWVKER
jgi:hypothetical protein